MFSVCLQDISKEKWLVKMRAEKGAEKKRKEYTCGICKEPTKNTGHTHYRGVKYCPNKPGQLPFEEWLTQCHTEYEAFCS